MSRPLVIAGHASGVGKTTVAIGLMGAFRRQGLTVAPFKVGPDYIDPGFHARATGVASRNLDTWLTSPGAVRATFSRGAAGADISIVEGVMGLFDGRAGGGDEGSTAEAARLTSGAVVLVVNCAGMARSLAPLLWGFHHFNKEVSLAGTILNNVGSPGHARMLRDAAREAGVPVLGEIPRRSGMTLGSRHLGLVPAEESEDFDAMLERIIDHVGGNVDLQALAAIAAEPGMEPETETVAAPVAPAADAPVIAVARDEAFSFYYVDSLEALEAAGARLRYFSPLRDAKLPVCDGLYLGGGFPEMFAGRLTENTGMRRSVAAAVAGGLPTYAECGGMVYLCRGVEVNGRRHEMTGAVESEARMTDRRQALGYVEARARRANILLDEGGRLRGHEFHWSTVEWRDEDLAYDCFSNSKPQVEHEGFSRGNLLATYVHTHFGGDHGGARRFTDACAAGSAR
ncbi:MAG: cobyrinate a,c-diamide synthase [Thermoleophilia bacterium]